MQLKTNTENKLRRLPGSQPAIADVQKTQVDEHFGPSSILFKNNLIILLQSLPPCPRFAARKKSSKVFFAALQNQISS